MFYSLGALNRTDIDLILLLRKTVTETSMYRTFRMRPASPPNLDTSAQSTRPANLLPDSRGLDAPPKILAGCS